jgi:transcriptional regulator of met regulon
MNGVRGTRGGPARRGLGRVEVLEIIVVLAIVLSLLIVMLTRARRNMRSMQDAQQLRQLAAAVVTFYRDFDGRFPLPSQALLRREGAQEAPEDFTLNHSANIYSMMLMQEYFPPEILVSPVEVLDHVTCFDPDYGRYSPADGIFWDDRFVMHIHDPAVGANGSYAHLAAVGERRRIALSDAPVPLFGNRAPGPAPGAERRSPTLRFHRPHDVWVGNVVFSDGHTATLENYFAGSPGDNIYAADFYHPMGPQAAADAFLAIYISATEFTVEDVYDPLD